VGRARVGGRRQAAAGRGGAPRGGGRSGRAAVRPQQVHRDTSSLSPSETHLCCVPVETNAAGGAGRAAKQAAQGAPPVARSRCVTCKFFQVLKAVTLLYNVETDERKAEARHVEQAAPRCPLPAVGVYSSGSFLLKKSNDRAAQVPPCPLPPAGRHSVSCIRICPHRLPWDRAVALAR